MEALEPASAGITAGHFVSIIPIVPAFFLPVARGRERQNLSGSGCRVRRTPFTV